MTGRPDFLSIAISNIRPGAVWSIHGFEIDWDGGASNFIWSSEEQQKPNRQEVEQEVTRLTVEWEAKEYARQRATEYPSLADQLDMLYHDRLNNTDNWLQTIQAVKDKYPKP